MLDEELKRRQKIFGENLERIRKERGKSRKELAAAVGVNETSFGAYCVGRHYPSVDKIFILAEILDCSIIDLIGDNPNAEHNKIFKYRMNHAQKILNTANFDFTLEIYLNGLSDFVRKELEQDFNSIKVSGTKQFYRDGNKIERIPTKKVVFESLEDFVDIIEEIEMNSIRKNIGFKDEFSNMDTKK